MEVKETFQTRFLLIAGEHPYSWAAKRGIPKHVVSSILAGNYMPQRKTLEQIRNKTGLSIEWLKNGVGSPYGEPVSAEGEVKVSYKDTTFHDSSDVVRSHYVEQEDGSKKFIGTQNIPREQTTQSKVAGTIAAGSADVDERKLALAAKVLEEWAAEKHLQVKPERKGAIIAVLYKVLMKGADIEDVERLLRAGNGL